MNKEYFGFKKVTSQEKNEKVQEVFDRVSPHYDLMNDLMSLGLHRWWKKCFSWHSQLLSNEIILDIATGTGDIALLLAQYLLDPLTQMTISDRNPSMLIQAQNNLWNQGVLCKSILCDAENLPFFDNTFNLTSISFGLRKITNKNQALEEMYRVLRPKGRAMILEFSHPQIKWIERLYHYYSWTMIPWLGKLVAREEDSYRYLVESIRMHPTQEELAQMMKKTGFQEVTYYNFHSGIVCLHIGYKQ